MGGIITSTIVLAALLSFTAIAFMKYRKVLRQAKGIERGLKMVPFIINLPPASQDTEVGGRDVRDVIEEKISQAESLYSVIASTAKKGFWSKFYGQRHLGFEILAKDGMVKYYVIAPVALTAVVQQAILSAYPSAEIEEVSEPNIFNPNGKISSVSGGELHLKKEYSYPIATFKDMKRDSMQTLLNALSTLQRGDGAAVQILIRPAKEGWDKRSHDLVSQKRKDKGKSGGKISFKDILEAFWKPPESKETKPEDKQLTGLEQSTLDAVEQKTRSAGYEVVVRIIASSETYDRSQTILHNIVASFALFDAPGLNGFTFTPTKDPEAFVTAFILRFFPPELDKDVLNSVELATLFHFPDQRFTPTSGLQRQETKQVDGPSNPPEQGLLLGQNIFRGIKKDIRLSLDDRRRHTYIVGQTGTGKSQLLENLAIQDMISGNGFAFIDPHGDAVESLLSMVPKERTEDVIYFNPGDMDHPMGLNMFEHKTQDQKDFLIQEAINMLYKLYDPQRQGIIGPRYEHLFRNAALTVMSDPDGGTLIDIPKLFNDRGFVQKKLQHVTDQTVLDFWQKEMPDSQRSSEFGEVKSWFVSKFGAFLSNTMMRNIIGQTKSGFDLREVMDNKKILLVNLSKGLTGELNSKLLGMIFIMKFQAAAMSRANIPEEQRSDFSLYVDEFQNFSTESFATILAEARKYRLNITVANQYIGQLTEDVRDAVFGNVGTILTLRCSASDADFLVKQFSPIFDVQDLIKLPNFQAVVKLMIRGVPSQPFSLALLPRLGHPNPQLGPALRQLSAAKFGRPRKIVEDQIFERLKTLSPPIPSPRVASGGPQHPSGGPMQSTPGSSSFLDEWLAKRRQQMASNNSLAQGPRPQVSAASNSQPLDVSNTNKLGPSGSSVNPTNLTPTTTNIATSNEQNNLGAIKPNTSDAHQAPKSPDSENVTVNSSTEITIDEHGNIKRP